MLTEVNVPGSDDEMLIRLLKAYGANLPRMFMLQQYVDGNAIIPDSATPAQQAGYQHFVKRSRLHVVETIRDARTARQSVLGFRTAAEDDDMGDEAAWSIFVRNEMGMQNEDLFNWCADFGAAHMITAEVDGFARWSTLNDWTGFAIADPERRWLNEAGVKVGFDPVLGGDTAILFRQGYYRLAMKKSDESTIPMNGSSWEPGDDWEWVGGPVKTKTEKCLMQSYRTPDGFGIWEKHLDTIDRINEITLNALTIIVMQSFRQRAVKGDLPDVYPEDHPNAGEAVDYDKLFETGPAALWRLPTGSEIWESAAADVTPVYKARREELKTLCSLTRTPQDVFDSENQSALGTQVSREPLKFAVEGMNRRVDTLYRTNLGIAFEIEGDVTRADSTQIETIFGLVVPSTMAEKAEAAPKFKAGNAPQALIDEQVFEMTPMQRRRAEQDRSNEAFNSALAGTSARNTANTLSSGA